MTPDLWMKTAVTTILALLVIRAMFRLDKHADRDCPFSAAVAAWACYSVPLIVMALGIWGVFS